MALTTCSECKREISDQASFCPGCGVPIQQNISKKTQATTQEVINKVLTFAGIFILIWIVFNKLPLIGAAIFGLR